MYLPNPTRLRLRDILSLVRSEFRRLTSSRMGTLALAALMSVPLLYGGLYLWANHDPQSGMSNLPVAITVNDAGAIDSDGNVRNAGDDIAAQLIEDGSFDWHRVDAATASNGVVNGTYSFAIIVPADFTASLQSVEGSQAHPAQIQLLTNDANNYVATSAGKTAIEAVRVAIGKQVGEEAASTMLLAISDIREQLSGAAVGATQLASGASDAASGATQLADGAVELDAGAAKLDDGAAQLAGGASTLADGLGTLRDQTASLPAQTQQLADGAAQVAEANGRIAGIGNDVSSASSDLVAGAADAKATLAQSLRDRGVDEATVQLVLDELAPLDTAIADADSRVQSAATQLNTLADGSQQLANGTATLAAATPQLTAGISQAASGADALSDGAQRLSSGASELHSGTSQLATGAGTLASGLGQLEGGAAQLRDGLNAGVQQIPLSSQSERDAQASTIADPVAVETSAVTTAGSYGEGLAPLFTVLAAWIGIYALFLIVRPISSRAVTAMRNPLRVALAGWLTPALLGAGQMLALFAILVGAVGITFAYPLASLGWLLLASATFAAIILALNVWLGSVGQFLGLVLMVVQLVTSGGTFPWQTLPAPLAVLHHLLPMSWAVEGMRVLAYGGDLSLVWPHLLMLVAALVGSLGLAALGVTRLTNRRVLRDLQPSLLG